MIDDDGEVVGREQEEDHHLNYTNSCNFFFVRAGSTLNAGVIQM